MQRSRNEGVDVLIVLMSLVAEGTPQLALQLARQWQQDGLRVEVMVMQPEPLDLQAEYQSLGLPLRLKRAVARMRVGWSLCTSSLAVMAMRGGR